MTTRVTRNHDFGIFAICFFLVAACNPEKDGSSAASGTTNATEVLSGPTDGDGTAEPTIATTGAICETAQLTPLAEHCAEIVDSSACDSEKILTDDQKDVIGRCRWTTAYSVDLQCKKISETGMCIYIAEGNGCTVPESCGDLNFGVYGRAACSDMIELIISPPKGPYCLDPEGWSLCGSPDPPPQCLCPCQEGF